MSEFDAVFQSLQDNAVASNTKKASSDVPIGKGIIATFKGLKASLTGADDTPAEERYPKITASFVIEEHPSAPQLNGKNKLVFKSYVLSQDKNNPDEPGAGWKMFGDLYKNITGDKFLCGSREELANACETLNSEHAGETTVLLTIAEAKDPQYPNNIFVNRFKGGK